MRKKRRLAIIFACVPLLSLSAVDVYATATIDGTAIIDWSSLQVTGPLSFIERSTDIEAQLDNSESSYTIVDDSENDWVTTFSVPLTLDDDTTTGSATPDQLKAEDHLTASFAAPFGFAFTDTWVDRRGEYEVTADGQVTITVDFSLNASGTTEFVGESAYINVQAFMELYVDGGVPVDADYQAITEILLNGASDILSNSGTLSVTYDMTSGATGFLVVRGFVNNFVSAIPEPTTFALLGFGVLGAGFARRRRDVSVCTA